LNRITRALLVLIAIVVPVVAVSAGTASAHRSDQSYLYLNVGDDDLRGTVQLPFGDLRSVFGMEIAGSPDDVAAEVAARLTELQDYADLNTSIGAGGSQWPLAFDGFELLFEGDFDADGLGHVILPYVADLQGAAVPQVIDLSFTPFLDEIPGRDNLALIANYWEAGVIGQESESLAVFNADNRSATVDLGDPSQWNNFEASLELGLDHIRTGPDHIFFILVLLLPSVLILIAGVWYPSPSFGRSFVRVLVVATMFTLAHSITFTLAGMDLLPLPPPRLTESLIALSIAAAALHNLKPILGHREWIIAFVFGLFHGMGFAGFVEELEISSGTKLVSLLGRNVGIEIGQAVVVLIVFPALFLLSRTRVYRPFFVITSLTLAVVSSLWVVERVFDHDFGFNSLIDKAVAWPRALWVCVVLTGLIGLYVLFERSRGRLVTAPSPAPPLDDRADEPGELVEASSPSAD
jgi:HupE / UreJ protein